MCREYNYSEVMGPSSICWCLVTYTDFDLSGFTNKKDQSLFVKKHSADLIDSYFIFIGNIKTVSTDFSVIP